MPFTADWFSHNIPNWKVWLADLKGREGACCLEVGAFEGRASVWLLTNVLTHPTSRMTCCDLWSGAIQGNYADTGEQVEARFDENLRPFAGRFEKRKGDSFEFLAALALAGRRFDGIYIDGDHYGSEVLRDAVLAFTLLRPGGILIFDDYLWRMPIVRVFPGEAIDAFLHVFRHEISVVAKGSQVAIRKNEVEKPCLNALPSTQTLPPGAAKWGVLDP
ncbi:MAG: class I SAM-dependent methyltransferase [Pirellulaceae bacterium]